ncbi:MAG: hypothetical protein ACLFR2_00340 [Candidatus Kapaibacterium sp.]
MIRKVSQLLLGLMIAMLLIPQAASGQMDESFRMKLESILHRYKNYRYSMISVYQVKTTGLTEIRNAIKAKEEGEAGVGEVAADEECVENASPEVRQLITNFHQQGFTPSRAQREFISRGIPIPDQFDCVWDALDPGEQVVMTIRSAYLITTRKDREELVPSTIIGMIVSYEDDEQISENVDRANPTMIYTHPELKQFDLDSDEYRAETMYELLENAFRQNNVTDKTLQAQGFDSYQRFLPPKYGVTKSLIRTENNISGNDIQKFLRISDGQPMDYILSKNEVIISPDLLSWKRYDVRRIVYEDGFVDTLSNINNSGLPDFGLELKYGLDEINYPSLWSERLTLNSIWQNVKLGVVLPTSGWAGLSEDLFDQSRVFTNAGVGIAFQADFPVMVIPESGIFHFEGSYLFGDAKDPSWRDISNDDVLINPEIYPHDYLIRATGQLHYTFGVAIDKDYLMRFGIGGTFYNAETWDKEVTSDQQTNEEKVEYLNVDDETVGGVSGSIELMVQNTATPYGLELQYFDESVYANFWLQIPVVENTLALRFDAKGYYKAFTDVLRPWEQQSMFIPMARVIIAF